MNHEESNAVLLIAGLSLVVLILANWFWLA